MIPAAVVRFALAIGAGAAMALLPVAAEGQRRDTTRASAPPRPAAAESAAAPACCTVVRLDGASATVTARETATGYTFRFEVKNRRLRASLRVGDPVWADFGASTVKLRTADSAACCAIARTAPPAPDTSGTSRDAGGVPANDPSNPPPLEFSICTR